MLKQRSSLIIAMPILLSASASVMNGPNTQWAAPTTGATSIY